jgi:hypothetical protein
MGLFCTAMLSMALELSKSDPVYEDLALKFIEHFVAISASLNALGGGGMWHAEDGFYYDHLRAGELTLPLRVRSLVGLLPLVACSVIDGRHNERSPETIQRLRWLSANVPEMATRILSKPITAPDGSLAWRHLLALPTREHLEQLLRVMFDEDEFLSPYGIRSVSKYHLDHPFVFEARGQRFEVQYQPGESDSWMFGGNSNWRGPVWVPMNVLIVEALLNYHRFYADDLLVEFPTGSGERVNLREAALRLADRIVSLMRPGPRGDRPVHGGEPRYARDPHFRDLLLFYEYFHGDTGRGCGASHQTGWSALIGVLAALLRRASDGGLP